jgi:hypothetical protein
LGKSIYLCARVRLKAALNDKPMWDTQPLPITLQPMYHSSHFVAVVAQQTADSKAMRVTCTDSLERYRTKEKQARLRPLFGGSPDSDATAMAPSSPTLQPLSTNFRRLGISFSTAANAIAATSPIRGLSVR